MISKQKYFKAMTPSTVDFARPCGSSSRHAALERLGRVVLEAPLSVEVVRGNEEVAQIIEAFRAKR